MIVLDLCQLHYQSLLITYSKDSKGCKSKLNHVSFKDNQLIFKCSKCKKNCQNDFNRELIKKLLYMHQFCNGDINKFVLLLGKGVHPYEHMDSCERLNETSLLDKKSF